MSYDQAEYTRRYKARKDAQEYLPYDPVTLERTLPTLASMGINTHKEFRMKYFQREFSLPAPHQDEWDIMINRLKQAGILSFRGGGKSVFFSKSYPLYFMLQDFNKCILLVTETDDLAKGYTSSIVEAMLKSPQLVRDFNTPALFDPLKGRQGFTRHEIHLKRSVSRKEDTFKAVGLGKKIIGYHPDLIILDDIIQEGKSRLTSTQIERWFDKVILPMRMPDTQVIIIGTRKDPEDIYNYIMKKGTFDFSVQRILNTIPDYQVIRDPDTKRILNIAFIDPYWDVYENARANVKWPHRYSLKDVCLIREEMTAIPFSGEMMNSPVVEEGVEFQRDWLQFYDLNRTLSKNLDDFTRWKIVMAVDIGGASRNSDYSCIASIATFGNRIYILRLNFGHWKIPTLLRQIHKDYQMWVDYGNKPQKVGIETNFMQKAVLEYLDEFAWLPLKGIQQQTKKDKRLETMETYFERGRVYVDPQTKGYNEFLIEYLNFPNAKHDDVMDALQMAIALATVSSPSHFGVYR